MADGTETEVDFGDVIERWGRPALPFLVIGAALMLGVIRGPGAGVLGFAGGILVLAISMLWGSLRMLVGEAPLTLDAAVAIGDALQADDRKRAVLRALKDLETEYGLGKITEEDFQTLSAQYRAEAKRILREIDEQMEPARKKAEELVAAHFAAKNAVPTAESAPKKKKGKKARMLDDEAAPVSSRDAYTPAESPAAKVSSMPPPETSSACIDCGASNDVDAVFCKKCGAKLQATSSLPN